MDATEFLSIQIQLLPYSDFDSLKIIVSHTSAAGRLAMLAAGCLDLALVLSQNLFYCINTYPRLEVPIFYHQDFRLLSFCLQIMCREVVYDSMAFFDMRP